MKLFTKEIDTKLFQQYPKGNDLENQFVVAKIFNPYGRGRWFLVNSDPNDPNYIWAIVELDGNVEVGSIHRQDLEAARITRFNFPLERDLGFKQQNAKEVLEGLRKGSFFKKGGTIEQSNNEMLVSQVKAIKHHADEISKIINGSTKVEAWVVGKVERAATDLSDITHYLDGTKFEGGGYMASGGEIKSIKKGDRVKDKYGIEGEVYNTDGEKIEVEFKSGATYTYRQKDFDNGEIRFLWADRDIYENEDYAHGGYTSKPLVLFTINDENVDNLLRNSSLFYEFKGEDAYLLTQSDFEKFNVMVSDAGFDTDEIMVEDYSYAKGGRTKSAINRDRKYTSQQEWEKSYVRKTPVVTYGEGKYGMGGKVHFKDKVKSISERLLKQKKVDPKYKAEYGKTYNKKESIEAASRIAGAMAKKEKLN